MYGKATLDWIYHCCSSSVASTIVVVLPAVFFTRCTFLKFPPCCFQVTTWSCSLCSCCPSKVNPFKPSKNNAVLSLRNRVEMKLLWKFDDLWGSENPAIQLTVELDFEPLQMRPFVGTVPFRWLVQLLRVGARQTCLPQKLQLFSAPINTTWPRIAPTDGYG